MAELPKDTKVLIIRRGENMRVMLPIHEEALFDVKPPEVAAQAIMQFLELQLQNPGRADMPVSMEKPMGLCFRGSPFVIDPEVVIGKQLVGRWEEMTVDILSEDVMYRELPCVLLNLDDIND